MEHADVRVKMPTTPTNNHVVMWTWNMARFRVRTTSCVLSLYGCKCDQTAICLHLGGVCHPRWSRPRSLGELSRQA